VNVPITNYRIPLIGADAEAKPAWQEASRNYVWTARHAPDATPYEVALLMEEGVARLPERERLFHVIPAGRTHRIEHGFGFWRTCGSDALYIKSPYEGGSAYMMVISTAPRAYETDTLHWACVKCGAKLRELAVPTRRVHLRGLIERALNEVRAFNADERARTCAGCGTVHPLAYGFEPLADTEEETVARASW
jgi:hypothetical protein